MDKEDMRTLLEMSITAQQHGAKAAEVSLIRSVVSALVEKLPTTATPTSTAPIAAGLSDAARGPILPMTPPSSQSDQVDTKSGPVELSCGCVVSNEKPSHLQITLSAVPREVLIWCHWHNVNGRFVLIPAQDVDHISLTSVKQPSNESAENLVEESVRSLSNEWTHKMCRETVLQDSICILSAGHEDYHVDISGNRK